MLYQTDPYHVRRRTPCYRVSMSRASTSLCRTEEDQSRSTEYLCMIVVSVVIDRACLRKAILEASERVPLLCSF